MPGIENDIRDVIIPESLLPKVIDELKKRHENQQLYFTQNIQQTRDEYDAIKEKMKRIYYDLLDRRITQTLHDEIAKDLEARQQILNDKLKLLTSDNKSFQINCSYLLDLAQRADSLFKCSKPELRQNLLEYMLSNAELDDKKLKYIVNEPFRSLIEQKKKSRLTSEPFLWQGIADVFQTAAINAQEDYKLKNLVELFQLSGDLIGA